MRKLILLINSFFVLFTTYSQSLDPSFAGKGYASINFPAGNFYFESEGQVLRKNDGSYYVLFHVNGFPVLTHYFADGDRDAGFGTLGYSQTINVNEGSAALQPDGKIVIAGQSFDPASASYDFGVARFNSNGTLDSSFAGDGVQLIDFLKAADAANAIMIQQDGKILIAGWADNPANGESHFALARLNPDGTPDTSYDGDGKQTTDFGGGYDVVAAIGIDPDNKIIAAGESYHPETGLSRMAVARYNPDGSPDNSFSGDGKTTTGIWQRDTYANALVIQKDGKIVLAGQVGESFFQNSAITLVRYNLNGTPDSTFRKDGKSTTNLFDSTAVATSIALQPDGKLVVGGYAINPNTGYSDFIVARYTTAGVLDNSFSKNGFLATDFDGRFDEVTTVIVQPDGKIVASGIAYNRKGGNGDYAMVRYQPDGSPDCTFGCKGALTGFYKAGNSRMNAVAVQPDCKVVVAGRADVENYFSDFGLARYNTNGTVDKSFGNNGKVTTDFLNDYDEVAALAIQPDGKIVAAGFAFNDSLFINEFAVARYNPDGTLDLKFGNNGKIVTDLEPYNNSFGGLALQPDGKIIVSGAVYYEGDVGSNIILLRYTANGKPDMDFDGDGKVITDFPSLSDEFATSVALQDDGKIVVSGYGFLGNSSVFILARYTVKGALDNLFNGNGTVVTSFSSDVFGLGMAVQPDGKIVVGGDTYYFDTDDWDLVLARYNSNGSLDKGFGIDGWQVTDIGGAENAFADLALQQDGKIVLLGVVYSTVSGQNDVSLTRYTTTGILDKTFDGDGSVLTKFFGYYNVPTGLAIRNNKAFVAVNIFTPEETSLIAAFQLGNVGAAQQINNRHLKTVDEKVRLAQISVIAQPNPSTQYFSLSLQSDSKAGASIRIIDASGRLVETISGVKPKSILQIGQNYSQGLYYAEVIQGKGKAVVRLVKQ